LPLARVPAFSVALDGQIAAALPNAPDADFGVVMTDLRSGARATLNEQRVYPSASVYKLALAWQVLRLADAGLLQLDMPLTIEPEDAVEPEPDGGVSPGDAPSVADAVARMVTASSNAAAHALLRTLGRGEFNAALAQLGLLATRVPLEGDPSPAQTTAQDVEHLLRLIAAHQVLSRGAETELLRLLANGGPPDALRETLPASVDVLDKTGNLDDASNVGALLRSARGVVILVVLDTGVDPGDARTVIAELGRTAYESFLTEAD
jgi:beta-lactamase class A